MVYAALVLQQKSAAFNYIKTKQNKTKVKKKASKL